MAKMLSFGDPPTKVVLPKSFQMDDPLLSFASAEGLIDGQTDRGCTTVCPWQHEHTDGARGSADSTMLLKPGVDSVTGQRRPVRYKCLHAHCAHRTTADFARAIGFNGLLEGVGLPADISAFSVSPLSTLSSPREHPSTALSQALNPQRYAGIWMNDAPAKMKPVAWAIRDVLPTQGLFVIYGSSTAGKSFFALAMCAALAGGGEFFGHKVARNMPVVYLALEGGGGFPLRIKAWCAHHKQPFPANARLIVGEAFHLTSPRDVADLIATLKSQGFQDGAVFVDTLNRASPNADENSGKDMSGVIEAALQVQRVLGGVVALVGHSGKDSSKGLRGHSSQFAAADGVIEVRRDGDIRSWRVEKAKDGEEGSPHFFQLQSIDLGQDSEGESVSSAVVAPMAAPDRSTRKAMTNGAALGLATLTECLADSEVASTGAPLEDWRQAFYRKSPAENIDAKRKAFNRARDELTSLGRVVVQDDRYKLSSPPDVFGF